MHWTVYLSGEIHALKEVDASAMARARTPAQVVDVLGYVITA